MSTNEAKTEEMIRTVKEKAEKKKAETLKILSAMEANGEGITFYRLAKKANVSKSFYITREMACMMQSRKRKLGRGRHKCRAQMRA